MYVTIKLQGGSNLKILIAEDNIEIVKVLELYLNKEGYEVDTVNNGLDALNMCKKKPYDLGIFDIMMPKMDGYELVTKVRKFSNMSIIFLSAKGEDVEKILGLNIGADDYITKPFNPLEVVARVNTALRRYSMGSDASKEKTKLEIGSLLLDISEHKLYKNKKEIDLTVSEFNILKILMGKENQIFSKSQISESIGGEYMEMDDSRITVHISHIREKIGLNEKGNQFIKTVRGLGYKIENK
jgi:DNA-binding response OmpR family regulator